MLKTNEIVDELMGLPRPGRRKIQEILKLIRKDAYENGKMLGKRIGYNKRKNEYIKK